MLWHMIYDGRHLSRVLHLQSVIVTWEGLQDMADKHAARTAILRAVNIGVTVEDLERPLLMLDRLECKYNDIADERARIKWDRFLQLSLEKGAKMAHRNCKQDFAMTPDLQLHNENDPGNIVQHHADAWVSIWGDDDLNE